MNIENLRSLSFQPAQVMEHLDELVTKRKEYELRLCDPNKPWAHIAEGFIARHHATYEGSDDYKLLCYKFCILARAIYIAEILHSKDAGVVVRGNLLLNDELIDLSWIARDMNIEFDTKIDWELFEHAAEVVQKYVTGTTELSS